jgi:hypothetical protein
MHICEGRQVRHARPLRPQLVCAGGKQRSPRQHPFRHVATEHAAPTQLPLRQNWPAVHERQRPASAPQAKFSFPSRHAPRGSMHPLHKERVHRPDSQRSIVVHCSHAPPSAPHASGRFPGWHSRERSRHPAVQLWSTGPASSGPASGESTHTPARQRVAEEHTPQSTPPAPQKFRLVPERHAPELSQQPVQVLRSQVSWHPGSSAMIVARRSH